MLYVSVSHGASCASASLRASVLLHVAHRVLEHIARSPWAPLCGTCQCSAAVLNGMGLRVQVVEKDLLIQEKEKLYVVCPSDLVARRSLRASANGQAAAPHSRV